MSKAGGIAKSSRRSFTASSRRAWNRRSTSGATSPNRSRAAFERGATVAGVRGRPAPLRPRQRPLRGDARPAHDLQLRLLGASARRSTRRRRRSWISSAASRLEPGMRLLDIGCGWGGLARFAAERYGVSVVGITVSKSRSSWGAGGPPGCPCSSSFRTIATSKGLSTSCRSACSSTSGAGTTGPFSTWRAGVSPRAASSFSTRSVPAVHRRLRPVDREDIFPNGLVPSMAQIAAALENRSSSRTGRASGRTTSPR